MEVNADYIPTPAAGTTCTAPAETLEELHNQVRIKEHSLYYWVRLFLTYGNEYRPDLSRIIAQIETLSDEMYQIEKSMAEDAQ
jgi:allophanate hydrolase subunit 1